MPVWSHWSLLFFLVLSLGTLPPGVSRAEDPPLYDLFVVDQLPGGTVSLGYALNANGDVAGVADNKFSGARGFFWSRGEIVDIGDLGLLLTWAFDLNQHDQIVGFSSQNTGQGAHDQAFIWEDGVMTALPPLLPNSANWANGINDHGVAVGRAWDTDPWIGFAAVRWDQEGVHKLETPGPGYSAEAFAINNTGAVVGLAFTGDLDFFGPCQQIDHAFIWFEGQSLSLGSLVPDGTGCSRADDLNDHGLVAGTSDIDDAPGSARHAFAWRRGAPLLDLGTLPGDRNSEARAVNNANQIVGTSESAAGQRRAVLWQQSGSPAGMGFEIVDLNEWIEPSSWELTAAMDINDDSVILALAERPGQGATVVLVPR